MRSSPPPVLLPEALPYAQPAVGTLSNGVALHTICAGTQDVVRVSLVFEAGARFQQHLLEARTTLALMSEGTKRFSGAQVADNFDFLGASCEPHIDKDFAMLTVYSLTRHLQKTLDTLSDMVLHPTFPEPELRTYCAKRKQQLRIDKERVAYVAREQLPALLYGRDHPYGLYADPEHYDALSCEWLHEFHRTFFTADRCFIVATGNVGERERKIIGDFFEQIPQAPFARQPEAIPPPGSQPAASLAIEKSGAVQSALRVGRVLFDKLHPDFAAVHMLSVILGGYFGSRLMRNIREEKGYTYGVFASLISCKHTGYLSIGAEVGKEFGGAALDEISKELQRLCDEKIPDDELTLAKNHLCGEIMRSLDGPWALAESAIEDLQYGLAQRYAETLFNTVKCATAARLQQVAQQYLNPQSMTSVIVG
ncbi:MAG: insulinase family protein [Prevotellaceae bacterium]|jgi:predicted Zn-dependent peptidase|nr:insulinase family protein [Prevotellaceae bacterium]